MLGATLSLIAVALLAAVGWRGEVEHHGWGGLTWLTYFHWAIPLGAALFAGWLALFGGARRRLFLAAGALILAALAYWLLYGALMTIYSRWPPPPAQVWFNVGLALTTLVGFPSGVWLLGRRCGAAIRLGPCLLALGCWLGAVPLAMLGLEVTHHIGGADFLHTIKSGFVIPPLLIALGLPFVWARRFNTPAAPADRPAGSSRSGPTSGSPAARDRRPDTGSPL